MQPAVSGHSEYEADGPTAPRMGFKRHLRVEVSGGERVYLFSEHGMRVLNGAAVSAVAPLLDGSRDVPGLLRDIPAGMSAEQVAMVVGRLMDAGVVAMRTVADDDDEAALGYWEGAGVDASTAARRTAQGTVGLHPIGRVDTNAAAKALCAAGLRTVVEPDYTRSSPVGDLSVVLCDDYLNPGLAQVDAVHRDAGRPWLLAKPTGATVWVGPVFQPPGPGCWHCLQGRLWLHRTAESHAQTALGRLGPATVPAVSVPALRATALHLVALEATKWLAGHRHPHQSAVWTFDSLDLTGKRHEFRAAPQCANCGDPSLMRQQARRPVVLVSREKVADGGGGHRVLSPEQVRERYQHLVSPVTGVIKEIRRDDRGPTFFNAFRSGANLAARGQDLDSFKAVLRQENGGKGVTAAQAEVGAMCEAIERYSGNFHGDEETVRGSLRSLGERALHPNACQLFHERQYRTRVEWNAAHSPFQWVTQEFDQDAQLDWTPVWSLTEQRHRLLPTGMLYFGTPPNCGGRTLLADSNGNAAGSCLEDAVLQGMLELVERDGVALWWYNRTLMPGVDLDSFGDSWIDELRDVYAEMHREVWVLDVTADLLVPTMVAVSRRTDQPRDQLIFGFGAHLDPRLALRRALTELNQMVPQLADLKDISRIERHDPDFARWWRDATLADQPYLAPDPTRPQRTVISYAYTRHQDIHAEITLLRHRIEALGMQMHVLNQTRPDTELPVAKVIVPGLRHFWARFAPGRLYDVPVQLGRRRTPIDYDDLNPYPMFL
ncbi:MAG TPA: TOMM precursor leader peptide-binding protein [Pseudonocardiaceae bacterium]|nr:TOMM precursor leader peptide-binding protein [Pseudonocardiaceae bacterium]